MIQPAIYSSRTEHWGTPPNLFAALNAIYNFQLDAAASDQNALCPHYFTPKQNALLQDWSTYGRVWLNPPYGRTIGQWMEKTYEQSRKGCIIVALVPARTDTRWWHEFVVDKAGITFLKGRLKYVDHVGNQTGSAPFPSAILTYPIISEIVGGLNG